MEAQKTLSPQIVEEIHQESYNQQNIVDNNEFSLPQKCHQSSVSKLEEMKHNSLNGQENINQIQYLNRNRQDNSIKENSQGNSEENSESGEENIKIPMKQPRQQKFKRSTNNSHKKFISVARRWMFKNYKSQLKIAFQNKFHALRSTRTYFFIILAFISSIMPQQKKVEFKIHFDKQVKAKIQHYQRQIQNTANENLKHFRSDQITDLKFSLKALSLFFQGDIQKSIQCVYKKDKISIVKKQHFEEALRSVTHILEDFKNPERIQQMIQEFGSKKARKNNVNNKQKSPDKSSLSSLINKNSLDGNKWRENQFLVPQMFGHQTSLNFSFQTNCQKEKCQELKPKAQEEIVLQWMDKQWQKSQKTKVDEERYTPEGTKIMCNLVVIGPAFNNQKELCSQNLIFNSSFTNFKPFRRL